MITQTRTTDLSKIEAETKKQLRVNIFPEKSTIQSLKLRTLQTYRFTKVILIFIQVRKWNPSLAQRE